jgi:sorbitol-6-phosphate 2-dehydrogenase
MNTNILPSLIRGLYLNAAEKPFAVVSGGTLSGNIPMGAFSLELEADDYDEQALAVFMSENFSACTAKVDGIIKLPSCVVVSLKDASQSIYWIAEDIDEAQRRMDARDASYLAVAATGKVSGMDASSRSAVVKGKIALVTGGAQGFGEEIVRGLTASGALVFIADLNIEGAEKLAEKLNAEEKRTAAIAVKVNVSDEVSVEEMFAFVERTAGGLDLCISNAGVLRAASVLEQSLKDFEFVTDINYVGFFIMSKFAGLLLRRQNRTAPAWMTDIIQINSKSGLEGSNKNGAYAGGKFGGIGLVASFAMELISYNIKVNAICPGNFLDGPLWSDPDRGLFAQYLKTGKVPGAKTIADVKAFYEGKVPMKRGCFGPDVMRAIFYVVEQTYETGQAIPVTGGQVMLH